MMAAAALVELQGPNLVRNVVRRIAAHDLAAQHRRLAATKGGIEGAHQQLRRLATVPFEIGQEDKLAIMICDTRHTRMKVIAVDAEWNDMHRPGHAAGKHGLTPE